MDRISVSQPVLHDEELELVVSCLECNQLTQGAMVRRFETGLRAQLGAKHVMACSSGTTALHLALAALGIGPGDEVLVPDMTFVATANAVRYCGAMPVLVDVNPISWGMDWDAAELAISSRTKAAVVVHLYGSPADMDRARTFATQHGLALVEDAAEGLGGDYSGEPLGTLGHAGTFSFYGNKVITTGEGGAVVTNDPELAARIRHLRGQSMDLKRTYWHDGVGFNYRMTELQAAVGVGQLAHFDELVDRRREVITMYSERLSGIGYTPCDRPGAAPWMFTLLMKSEQQRNQLRTMLASHGIETRPTFVPMHRLPIEAAKKDGYWVSTRIGDCGVSLPTHPALADGDVDRICDLVLSLVAQGG